MELLSKITALGFTAEALPDNRRKGTVYKIRTSNGWTYERFQNEAEIDLWAIKHKPEAA